jgi:hypothetical protein
MQQEKWNIRRNDFETWDNIHNRTIIPKKKNRNKGGKPCHHPDSLPEGNSKV